MQQNRFTPSKKVILIDRFMSHFIKVGGLGLIAAVLGIFLFIFFQILPLFKGASIKRLYSYTLPQASYTTLGADEWGEKPFLLVGLNKILFLDSETGKVTSKVLAPEGFTGNIIKTSYDNESQSFLHLTSTGEFFISKIIYEAQYNGEKRSIISSVDYSALYPMGGILSQDIVDLSFGWSSDEPTVAFISKQNGSISVETVNLSRSQSLMSEGELEVASHDNLTANLEGTPDKIRLSATGDILVILTKEGHVFYFQKNDHSFSLIQKFVPFENQSQRAVSSMEFILGGVSLSFVSEDGSHVIYSLLIPKGENKRLFVQTKNFDKLPSLFTSFSKSLRNKALLLSGEHHLSLRYATTEQIRLEKYIPDRKVKIASLSTKYDKLLMLDDKSVLTVYRLKDPHPEGGWRAFFGKIWYEGANEPGYTWQSSGGSDSFEAKLSLVPLIVGTLKGTFYALLFAVPIALLAAVYTSEFLHPRFRAFIKPTLEIMASLPSVILGFLAALWLAPLVEARVPSLVMVVLLLPFIAMGWGYFWSKLPVEKRSWLKQGNEVFLLIPVVIIGGIIAWNLGPVLEHLIFYVHDAHTGEKIADFRKWWVEVTGLTFEQRNSLVVGFIMGFAVIPLIFTITDDSLSNVPRSLRSASLACGASRWQTAWKVVLPAASAGIFSAIMIGFGRAVGETMIVLMATGNTPIMDWNIFSGMRTLSANLAVELPEAPFQGTLYRTLYLGAFVLFIMTFVVNTIADVMRQIIRKKYKML
ncbi:ABC transporter permease subunit [bacterium]|nr:ABC transporter permease subunit [bacterium]